MVPHQPRRPAGPVRCRPRPPILVDETSETAFTLDQAQEARVVGHISDPEDGDGGITVP